MCASMPEPANEVVGVVRLRWIEELKSADSHATNKGFEQPLPDLLACEDALRLSHYQRY
jgi:hypothetical protein